MVDSQEACGDSIFLSFSLQDMAGNNPTQWLPALQNGDEKAEEHFWQEYFLKTVRLAKRRMQGLRLRAVDEEDIAISAMKSFCCLAQKRDEPIENSTDTWKLLATIVRRKVNKERQRQFAAKRQEYRLQGESLWESDSNKSGDTGQNGLAQISGREPTPELAMELAETWDFILALPNAEELVTLKNEGHSNSEIAQRLGCSTRTVQRDLEKIRTTWENWQIKVRDEFERTAQNPES